MKSNVNYTMGIHIPEFANLKLYDGGFKVTVAFHVTEHVAHKISIYFSDEHTSIGRDSQGRYIVIRARNYSDNLPYKAIQSALWCQAFQDKTDLMQIMRLAKIYVLEDELEDLYK